jgi:hypothetical protein
MAVHPPPIEITPAPATTARTPVPRTASTSQPPPAAQPPVGGGAAPGGSSESEWRQFLNDPSGKAAMMQFAVSVLQPPSPGQTTLGHIASSVGQGAAAAGRTTTAAQERSDIGRRLTAAEELNRITEEENVRKTKLGERGQDFSLRIVENQAVSSMERIRAQLASAEGINQTNIEAAIETAVQAAKDAGALQGSELEALRENLKLKIASDEGIAQLQREATEIIAARVDITNRHQIDVGANTSLAVANLNSETQKAIANGAEEAAINRLREQIIANQIISSETLDAALDRQINQLTSTEGVALLDRVAMRERLILGLQSDKAIAVMGLESSEFIAALQTTQRERTALAGYKSNELIARENNATQLIGVREQILSRNEIADNSEQGALLRKIMDQEIAKATNIINDPITAEQLVSNIATAYNGIKKPEWETMVDPGIQNRVDSRANAVATFAKIKLAAANGDLKAQKLLEDMGPAVVKIWNDRLNNPEQAAVGPRETGPLAIEGTGADGSDPGTLVDPASFQQPLDDAALDVDPEVVARLQAVPGTAEAATVTGGSVVTGTEALPLEYELNPQYWAVILANPILIQAADATYGIAAVNAAIAEQKAAQLSGLRRPGEAPAQEQ